MNKKDYIACFSIIILVLFISYLGINRISYFDAKNFCYISISNDILRGNRRTIIEALHLIKGGNKEDYKNVCSYVNRISENFCIAADWHLDPKWMENAQGRSCYIKGSKTIYLFPQEEGTSQVANQRATEIIKLSRLSKEFWQREQD